MEIHRRWANKPVGLIVYKSDDNFKNSLLFMK